VDTAICNLGYQNQQGINSLSAQLAIAAAIHSVQLKEAFVM
jgi:hypothetical protein